MPRLRARGLGGYILEELLAYLVKGSGYSLIVSQRQDPTSLAVRGNGLVVKGRGSEHQVDVLGELDWIPAFTFPLRLFLEAKAHDKRLGIGAVRNAVGVLTDINQRNVQSKDGQIQRRYRYAYALFSTSGFSRQAGDMALAHEISLLDMSGPQYSPLRRDLILSANALLRLPEARDKTQQADAEDEAEEVPSFVRRVRDTIRRELHTDPQVEGEISSPEAAMMEPLAPAIETARSLGELFVGMAAGPYMLLLQASDRQAFVNRMIRNPVLPVTIHYQRSIDQGQQWEIESAVDDVAIKLTFRLPEPIARWIFSEEGGSSARARLVKSQLLPHIYVPYRDEENIMHFFRLDYEGTTGA